MTDTELAGRIRPGEDSTLELKSIVLAGGRVRSPDGRDLADELAAMANTRGGTVLLGVDDRNREILGIPLDGLDAVEGWVREICNDSVKPPLDADIYKLELAGRRWTAGSHRSRRHRAQPVRAPEPRRVLPQDRQLPA